MLFIVKKKHKKSEVIRNINTSNFFITKDGKLKILNFSFSKSFNDS